MHGDASTQALFWVTSVRDGWISGAGWRGGLFAHRRLIMNFYQPSSRQAIMIASDELLSANSTSRWRGCAAIASYNYIPTYKSGLLPSLAGL
jgi:hypothetical protein